MSATDMQGVRSQLTRLRAFCLPGGELVSLRGVRSTPHLPAVPIDRVCSASALSPLHGAPLAASFASGKASAYPLSWKFPGIYRKVSSLTTGAKLRRSLRRVEKA
jgi:hypothetical protein